MDEYSAFGPGCQIRYQGRVLVVRAATTSIVVAVPSQIRGEPDRSTDCICIDRSELRESDVIARKG